MSSSEKSELKLVREKTEKLDKTLVETENILQKRENEILSYFDKHVKKGNIDANVAEGIRLLFLCAKFSISMNGLESKKYSDLFQTVHSITYRMEDLTKYMQTTAKTPEMEQKLNEVSNELNRVKNQMRDTREDVENFFDEWDDMLGSLSRGKKGDKK